jgi:glutamyl-tRNA reductase
LEPIVVGRGDPRKGGTSLEALHHSATEPSTGENSQPKTQGLRVSSRPPYRTIAGVPALVGLSLTHRTAPLAVRERLALAPAQASDLLTALVAGDAVDEAVAVSTCNRIEVYVAGEDAGSAEWAVVAALARHAGMSTAALGLRLRALRGRAVADHLFAVASGLDSMVIGETEILGQLRRAHELAREAHACGLLLDRLMRGALGAGRRVRAGTAIARSGVSVSSAAVELAREALGSLAERRVMLVGAGKSSEVTARVLRSQGVGVLRVANRSHERAAEIARRDGGAVALDDLEAHLAGSDLVIAATACPHVLIDAAMVRRAMARRAGRPLVVIDLAVPRDVDPGVRDIRGVTLLDLDDVQARVARNRAARQSDVAAARALIAGEVDRFERWRAARAATPTIAALKHAGDAIVGDLLALNAPHWESLTDADRERVEALARAVARRLLHEPTRRVKQAACEGDTAPERAARDLFGLGTDVKPAAPRVA